MHIAETREQAHKDMEYGLLKLVQYFEKLGNDDLPYSKSVKAAIEHWTEEGLLLLGRAIIGSPEDAVARIEELEKQSGGFGAILILAHDCANPSATHRSYELFAGTVMPALRQANRGRIESLDWFRANSATIVGDLRNAIGKTISQHEAERAERGSRASWGDPRNLLVGGDDDD